MNVSFEWTPTHEHKQTDMHGELCKNNPVQSMCFRYWVHVVSYNNGFITSPNTGDSFGKFPTNEPPSSLH